MKYQPEIGGEYRTGYVKTLIKTKELSKDLEKMVFLSEVLIHPDLKFYAVSQPPQQNSAENPKKWTFWK